MKQNRFFIFLLVGSLAAMMFVVSCDWIFLLTRPTTRVSQDKKDKKDKTGSDGETTYNAVFVSTTGDDGNSGLDPSESKASITAAIAAAQTEGRGEVKVAAGTYNISAIITMTKGISLKGGYNADFSSRNIDSNVTKIYTDSSIAILRYNDPTVDNNDLFRLSSNPVYLNIPPLRTALDNSLYHCT